MIFRALLAVCGQALELPAPLQSWLAAASRHPGVERALAPWRTSTDAWLVA